jgi:hypothetical protein
MAVGASRIVTQPDRKSLLTLQSSSMKDNQAASDLIRDLNITILGKRRKTQLKPIRIKIAMM